MNTLKSLLLGSLLSFSFIVQAEPIGTSFTYQGELQQLGNPASGIFDFQFDLFTVPNDGSPVGITIQIDDTDVVDGVFTVELDFGSIATDGEQLWLEISVRDGLSAGDFSKLLPRQIINATPFAVHALTVPDGSITAEKIDTTSVQKRVTGVCSVGSVVRAINADGGVVCEPDTDTQLSEGEVDAFVANNGYSTGEHTVDTDTQLSEGEVDAFVSNNGYSTGEHTVDTDTTYSAGDGLVLSGTTFSVDSTIIRNAISGSCEPGYAMTGINTDGSVSCIRLTELPLYSLDGQDPASDVGRRPSIAIRGDGLPIIAYWDYTNVALKIFICANKICSSGTPTILDDSGGGPILGAFKSAAIGLDGFPIIAYNNGLGGVDSGIRVYKCSDVNCVGGGFVTIATGLGSSIGIRSMVVAANGNPLIAYYDGSNVDLGLYRCTSPDCSTGSEITLDSAGGIAPSIVIRPNGKPIIAYRWGMDLKVYDCADSLCSTGTIRTLETLGVDVLTPVIAINSDGKPLIAYGTGGTYDLKIYYCSSADCSSGSSRVLDSISRVTTEVDIALGLDGNAVVSYVDGTAIIRAIRVYVCSNSTCSIGESKQITDNASSGDIGTTIALSSEGNPLVSFYGQGFLGLKACSDAHCVR